MLSYQQVEDFFAQPYLTLCCVPGSMFYFPAVFLRPNNRLDTNANSRARAVHEKYCQFMFRRLWVEKGVAIVLSLHNCQMRGVYCIVWTFVSAVHLRQRPRRYFDLITIRGERTKVRSKNMMNFYSSCAGVRMCYGSVEPCGTRNAYSCLRYMQYPAHHEKQTAFEIRWHTCRNQVSSFGETDESI